MPNLNLLRPNAIALLKDPDERVIQIACGELGHRGGDDARAALFETLSHPTWRARLEACKALITLRAADQRVVSTLEAMSHETEAAKYDEEVADFQQRLAEMGNPKEFQGSWGKIAAILEQARQIAAK
jgi:HEAT repeat protein